jgi:hypothetical protein
MSVGNLYETCLTSKNLEAMSSYTGLCFRQLQGHVQPALRALLVSLTMSEQKTHIFKTIKRHPRRPIRLTQIATRRQRF